MIPNLFLIGLTKTFLYSFHTYINVLYTYFKITMYRNLSTHLPNAVYGSSLRVAHSGVTPMALEILKQMRLRECKAYHIAFVQTTSLYCCANIDRAVVLALQIALFKLKGKIYRQ